VNAETIGPMPKNPNTARISPRMPAEKLSTSISKPGRILPSHSVELLHHPAAERAHDHRAHEHRHIGAATHPWWRWRRPRRRESRRPSATGAPIRIGSR
jgi:hypothetical protein